MYREFISIIIRGGGRKHGALECNVDMESYLCHDGKPVQSSQNRGDVIASPCTENHLYECVENLLQLPEIFGGCSMENGVTVVETGADHRTCHHASRHLVDTCTYVYDVRL